MTADALLTERVRIVVKEVEMGRVGRDRDAIDGYVAEAFTAPADDLKMITMAALREVHGISEPKRKPMVKPVNGVLRGRELELVGAALFRVSPELSAPDAYRNLLQRGYKVGVELSSWTNGGMARDARRIAATDAKLPALQALEREFTPGTPARKAAAPEPKSRTKADRPAPRPRTAVARRPAVAAAPEPARRRTPPSPLPPPLDSAPPKTEVLRNGEAFHDGDKISIEIDGEKLEARRSDGRWLVEFEGTFEDALMARLMGRMLTGVAG